MDFRLQKKKVTLIGLKEGFVREVRAKKLNKLDSEVVQMAMLDMSNVEEDVKCLEDFSAFDEHYKGDCDKESVVVKNFIFNEDFDGGDQSTILEDTITMDEICDYISTKFDTDVMDNSPLKKASHYRSKENIWSPSVAIEDFGSLLVNSRDVVYVVDQSTANNNSNGKSCSESSNAAVFPNSVAAIRVATQLESELTIDGKINCDIEDAFLSTTVVDCLNLSLGRSSWGNQLQIVVLKFVRKASRTNNVEKGEYIKIIISFLNARSLAVVYECANTLVSLSFAPTTIRAAANMYSQLLLAQSDKNVKLIVLDRLNELKASHKEIMVKMIMDVLRALSSPNLDIRRTTSDIVMELITPRNIDEVVMTLKKEVMKTQSGELEKDEAYRQMLVQAIPSCAIKFPGVIIFVPEIIESYLKLRVSIITRLLGRLYQIRATRVCSYALWIFGDYCLSLSDVESGRATIKHCLGDLSFYTFKEEGDSQDESKKSQQVNSSTISSKRPAIFTEGTYAGDFFIGVVVACTLTKLVLRLEGTQPSNVEGNATTSNALLIRVSMVQLGQSLFLPHPLDNDSHVRILQCIRLLCNTSNAMRKIWLEKCKGSFVKMLSDKQLRESEEILLEALVYQAQPDDLFDFYHLKSRKGMSQFELEEENVSTKNSRFIKKYSECNLDNVNMKSSSSFADDVGVLVGNDVISLANSGASDEKSEGEMGMEIVILKSNSSYEDSDSYGEDQCLLTL